VFDDATNHATGQIFDEVQDGEDSAVRKRSLLPCGGKKKTVCVMFLGGMGFTNSMKKMRI
jgi:hypothetical protein